ncbi:phenylalanine 2-monooxygenase precursor-like [Planococcus citri]|uniref:phenylalanine 2-monooxygenase precursor-like n=1 Tax=Planococcus citri TaxID=170843 RepID=UPI0031FA17A6
MGISVIPTLFDEDNLPASESPSKTIKDVRQTGRFYRHPDSAMVSYPLVVEKAIGSIPKNDEKLKIAIIGGGAAGIASCYELSRLGNSDRIEVTLYESDPDHFTYLLEPQQVKIDTFGKRAGRVFAARTSAPSGDEHSNPDDHTVYEIGAMRFPEIAGLTWHYAGQVFKDTDKVDAFPNPGKVPTEFVFGDRADRYYNKSTGGMWLDEDSPTKRVFKVVHAGIFGSPPTADGPKYPRSHFCIGCKEPYEVAAELKNENTSEGRLRDIFADWKEFAIKYDSLSLESAVRQVIRAEVKKGSDLLPDIAGLRDREDKIAYYAELFGCFGFGTGGFKPIHNASLTEMMRIMLWDYANEYTLPKESASENVDLFKELYSKAYEQFKRKPIVKHARVCDVCHSGRTGKALVFSYEMDSKPPHQELPGLPYEPLEFDYVILAVTPKQMHSIISRAGFNNQARFIRFGDYDRQYPQEILARPPLVLSKDSDAPNALLFTAINQVHMVGSSKIFVTVKEEDVKKAPKFFEEGEIKAVVSDCGLASSYFVPSPLRQSPDGKKYYSLLLSYSWEEDTKRLQHHLYEYPMNRRANSEANKQMLQAAINRTKRDVRDPLDGTYKSWWFGDLLSSSDLSDVLSYDWTTAYSAGGFKFDTTGNHRNSNLCFRYHTHAQKSSLDNRFFIAGDSYSHLGGWIEGAFISAVNAVTGLVVAANGGDIRALTEPAQKVITTLDSVV